MDLVPELYSVAKKLPRREQYGLASQIQRAAISVPTNIAEGQAQGTPRHFANYLSIALGSLAELDTLMLICVRLGYVPEEEISEVLSLLTEVRQIIQGLLRKVKGS